MRIRKYSVAWFATRKPVQVIVAGIAVAVLVNNLAVTNTVADTVTTPKIEPQKAETVTIEELTDYDNFINEVKEINPCKNYDVPLDAETKLYVETMCRCYEIDPAIVYGIMKVESNFNQYCEGDNGNSLGLMQIQPRWNKARMEELNITDLMDAKQNAHCGIDILAELLEKYDSLEMALTCYNYGEAGAQKYVFSKGVYSSKYSEKVLNYAYTLTE